MLHLAGNEGVESRVLTTLRLSHLSQAASSKHHDNQVRQLLHPVCWTPGGHSPDVSSSHPRQVEFWSVPTWNRCVEVLLSACFWFLLCFTLLTADPHENFYVAVTVSHATPPGGLVAFFLACENFWTMFDHSVSICIFLSGFFKWRLAPAHKLHFLSQDQPTVALQAEMTVSTIAATPPIMAIVPYYFRCYSTNTSNNPNISWRSIPYNLSHQCKASTK